MKNWKAIVGVCLVFVLGAVAGSLATGIVIKKRVQYFLHGGQQAVTDTVVKRLTRNLDLDPAQQAKVREIVTDAGTRIKEERRKIQPEIIGITIDCGSRIRETLNPEQQKKYDAMVDKLRPKIQRIRERLFQ